MPQDATVEKPVHSDDGKVCYADADAAALIAPALPILGDPAAAGWEKVKGNDSRTVYRGRVGEREVYVKRYHGRSWGNRLLRRLGLSDARREMQFSLYLRQNGIPTARPLAYVGGARPWFCTAAVTGAQGGDVWHRAVLAGPVKGQKRIRQATVELARLVGRMHAGGLMHCDLHCGNVLVREDGGRIELVLMDLHRMRRRRRLSRLAMAGNLAQLFHDRLDFTTRTERLRFLKHYLKAMGRKESPRPWQMLVERLVRRHTRRQYANRDRRIAGDGRYFTRLRLGGHWRGLAVLSCKQVLAGSRAAAMDFSTDDWRKALEHLDGLLNDPFNEVIKDSAGGCVHKRRLRVGANELDVFVKRPRRKHAWKVLLDCFRPSRSRRAFFMGHQLLNRRIATALPLVCLDRRIGPVLLESVLITEAVHCPRLKPFLNTWLSLPPQPPAPDATAAPADDIHLTVPQQKRLAQQVLWQMGRMLQRLHDNRYAHRDLKAHNLLVRWESESPELVLVDLDGLKRVCHITQRRRYQGLMRLNVSLLECPVVNHAGRLRMLLGYLRRPGSGRINFKPYWRTLEEWSARKLRQQIRSRRRRQRAERRPGA